MPEMFLKIVILDLSPWVLRC